MTTIDQFTAWFKQNIGWIKTVAILLLIGFLILTVTNIGCVRKQRDKFIKETTTLHILNDSLSKWNNILGDSLTLKDTERVHLEKRITVLDKTGDSLRLESKIIKAKYDSIPEAIRNMSTDSIYKFLNVVAYPYLGIKDYPFNEPQVRKIDENYTQNIQLKSLVIIMDKELLNSGFKFSAGDSLILTYRKSMSFVLAQNKNLNQTVTNKDKEILLYKKQEKQANRNGILWKISTGVSTVLALIFAFK